MRASRCATKAGGHGAQAREERLTSPKNRILFSQGDTADAVFYIQEGRVKVSVVSQEGKEAVIAMLEGGTFFGESCLAGRTVRTKTATTVEDSRLVRIDKEVMIRLLHEEPAFSELFLTHLLSRNLRIQEDVVDHLFNSSEKRLARVLLLLAHCEKDGRTEAALPKLNQETLAEMIGTTRARVSFFMNKFRKLGFIDYNSKRRANVELHVHRSLRTVVLDDGHPSCGRSFAQGTASCGVPKKYSTVSNCDQMARCLFGKP